MPGSRGHLDSALGDFFLRLTGPPGELFNCPTIPITCGEIHFGIHAGWVKPKQLLHAAEMFEELSPIQQSELS